MEDDEKFGSSGKWVPYLAGWTFFLSLFLSLFLCDLQRHSAFPFAVVFGTDEPVRDDADGLMHEFKSAFRIADCLNGKGPKIRDPRDVQLHAEFLPIVGQTEERSRFGVQAGAQVAETQAAGVVKIAVFAVSGKAGEIEF